jgi:hypothetical protein
MRVPRLLLGALLGLTVLGAGSCGNPDTLAPRSGGPAAQGDLQSAPGQLTGLLQCTPLPADSVSQLVGPDGGTIVVGPHSLVIPAGALADTVTITAVAPSDTVNRVHFEPTGLAFQQSASLNMSYANCNLLGLLLPKRIAYIDDGLNILYYLLSVDHFLTRSVSGRLDHFSEYAVAW